MEIQNNIITPLVNWVFSWGGVTIYDSQTGRRCSFPYPYAALWDGVTKGYNFEELANWYSVLEGVDRSVAREELLKTLQEWKVRQYISWQM